MLRSQSRRFASAALRRCIQSIQLSSDYPPRRMSLVDVPARSECLAPFDLQGATRPFSSSPVRRNCGKLISQLPAPAALGRSSAEVMATAVVASSFSFKPVRRPVVRPTASRARRDYERPPREAFDRQHDAEPSRATQTVPHEQAAPDQPSPKPVWLQGLIAIPLVYIALIFIVKVMRGALTIAAYTCSAQAVRRSTVNRVMPALSCRVRADHRNLQTSVRYITYP